MKNKEEAIKPRRPNPKRVLKLIEILSLFYGDSPKSSEIIKEILDQIYRYSHLISNCKNPHYKWRKEFYIVEKFFKQYEKNK